MYSTEGVFDGKLDSPPGFEIGGCLGYSLIFHFLFERESERARACKWGGGLRESERGS